VTACQFLDVFLACAPARGSVLRRHSHCSVPAHAGIPPRVSRSARLAVSATTRGRGGARRAPRRDRVRRRDARGRARPGAPRHPGRDGRRGRSHLPLRSPARAAAARRRDGPVGRGLPSAPDGPAWRCGELGHAAAQHAQPARLPHRERGEEPLCPAAHRGQRARLHHRLPPPARWPDACRQPHPGHARASFPHRERHPRHREAAASVGDPDRGGAAASCRGGTLLSAGRTAAHGRGAPRAGC
jgi:hypothetical protein